MAHYFTTLNYSASNEDGRSELRALEIRPSDVVVCVTGSGSRTLDLLLAGPSVIYSVDMNPCQNHLLELKIAAIRTLTYTEFLGFLGVTDRSNRLDLYRQIRTLLSPPATIFWDRHETLLQRGIIYQGRWERFFRKLARILSIFRSQSVRRLFALTSLSEQRDLFENEWNGHLWRFFIRSISSTFVWKRTFGDPGFFRYVPEDFSTGSYILDCFEAAFQTRVLAQSPFMSLLLRGRYDTAALPLHLMSEHFQTLRENSCRVMLTTASLSRFLESQPPASINTFSLSDIASYITHDEYRRLWRAIGGAAAPGARVCERQFLVKRHLPPGDTVGFVRNPDLEEVLGRDDDSSFYTFVTGTLQ